MLKTFSEQKKAQIRKDWEAKIKNIITNPNSTNVLCPKIETESFPASRNYELNAHRRIVCDILDTAGIKYSWIQSRKMGWKEWHHKVIFTLTLM